VTEPVALLGETIDVRAHAARLRLPRAPGRNLAVLGTRADEASAVLGAAGRSLHRQYPPGAARFSVVCLDSDSRGAAEDLRAVLPEDTGWYGPEDATDLFKALPDDPSGDRAVPHFILGYALDAAEGRTRGRTDQLRQLLHDGPERHVHILGWWRSVARLREDLGGVGARIDPIGAWVGLDIHGGDFGPLYPQSGGPPWYPRPWRGIFFDRTVHRTAETIIPYGLA
jgi:hypothetical protein